MIEESTNLPNNDIPNDEIICSMISANGNTLLNGADYSNTYNCLAYTSSNLIHIYDPKNIRTYLTLRGHKDRVNAVKWFESHNVKNDLIELISCSSDGFVNHWVNTGQGKNPFDYKGWKLEKSYSGSDPNQSINCINNLYISSIEKYFICFSSTGFLDLFYFDIDLNEFKLFHSIPFKKKLQDAICLTVLNNDYLLLLTGGYDSMINVYTVMRVNEINRRLLSDKVNFCPVSYKLSITGHQNAIRGIIAINPVLDNTKETYFASCSQDTYIRLWHVVQLDTKEIYSLAETINQKGSLSIFDEYKSKTSYVIKTENDEFFNIILDSILSGHEESVSSIKWGYNDKNKPLIISSSFDFTVGIWSYDDTHNIWNKEVTLGEMDGNKHAFYDAMFIENYKSILAYTYNGSFYLWRATEDQQYKSEPIVHGHFGVVSDLDWDPSNSFLISASEDQTTRAYAFWKNNNSWHEINRPQIHGYDINTIACLNSEDGYICKLVSGADEKVLRIFTPPYNIIKFLNSLSDITLNYSREKDNQHYEKYYSNVEGTKQALGLMTKQVKVDVNVVEDEENFDFTNFNPEEVLSNKNTPIINVKYNYNIPPDEDFLTNNTLWPEYSKLYGHGYEIISTATSHCGKITASGGKAQSEKHSKLFLWNNLTNNLICKLDGHVLTIVQIEFSFDDKYILTVSRDRSWCIYEKNNSDEKMPYVLIQTEKETHARIIWGCSWSKDSNIFVTGSRDESIKIWGNSAEKCFKMLIEYNSFKESVTSVNLLPVKINNLYILVVGFLSGDIKFLTIDIDIKHIKEILKVHQFLSHGSTVKRIKSFINNEKIFKIATCSEDHSVRIYSVSYELIKKSI